MRGKTKTDFSISYGPHVYRELITGLNKSNLFAIIKILLKICTVGCNVGIFYRFRSKLCQLSQFDIEIRKRIAHRFLCKRFYGFLYKWPDVFADPKIIIQTSYIYNNHFVNNFVKIISSPMILWYLSGKYYTKLKISFSGQSWS